MRARNEFFLRVGNDNIVLMRGVISNLARTQQSIQYMRQRMEEFRSEGGKDIDMFVRTLVADVAAGEVRSEAEGTRPNGDDSPRAK